MSSSAAMASARVTFAEPAKIVGFIPYLPSCYPLNFLLRALTLTFRWVVYALIETRNLGSLERFVRVGKDFAPGQRMPPGILLSLTTSLKNPLPRSVSSSAVLGA